MASENNPGAVKAATIAMLIAAGLSILYGLYQLYVGGSSIAFFIAGALLGAFAAVISASRKKSGGGG